MIPFLLAKRRNDAQPRPIAVFAVCLAVMAIGANAMERWWIALMEAPGVSYQPPVPLCVAGAMVAYGRITSLPWLWSLAALAAATIGASIAFYTIYFSDNWWTPFALVNFLHFMSFDVNQDAGVTVGADSIAWMVLTAQRKILTDYFLSDQISRHDYVFQAIFVGAALFTLVALFKRSYRLAAMSGYLTLVALLLPALFSPRNYRFYYSSWLSRGPPSPTRPACRCGSCVREN
jgi:hypothetical protein